MSARFFQPSISPASIRGGQRFSSMFAACTSCFSRRTWSSVSRMVKFDFRPTSSAWRRRSFTQIEWKVPSQGIPSTAPPTSAATRSFISRAALLVKVTDRISFGRALPVTSRCAIRAVSARVLPVPAPASISTGPSSASTACRCAGFSPSRNGAGRAGAMARWLSGRGSSSKASAKSGGVMPVNLAPDAAELKQRSANVPPPPAQRAKPFANLSRSAGPRPCAAPQHP